MDTSPILEDINQTLDSLIRNARCLNDCDEEITDQKNLTQKQETLLDHLFMLNASLDDTTKQELLQKKPKTYGFVNAKINLLSSLNKKRLKKPKERWTKKARVHRNRKMMSS